MNGPLARLSDRLGFSRQAFMRRYQEDPVFHELAELYLAERAAWVTARLNSIVREWDDIREAFDDVASMLPEKE